MITRACAAFLAARWGWLAVIAVALLLRLPHLEDRSVWYDEASSWQTARFDWSDLRRSLLLNVHLPLYYIILKGWMTLFGESATAIRALSVLFGVTTVLVMEQFGRELFLASAPGRNDGLSGDRQSEAHVFGLFVAMLVAMSPVQVFASIEARMYTMGTAFTALCAWLLLRIIRMRGHASWSWAAYGLAALGVLYSHHYGLFSMAAQAVFFGLYLLRLFGAGQHDVARRLMAGGVVVAILVALAYLPAFAMLQAQSHRVQQDYWIRPLSWETFSTTFSQFVVPDHDDIPRAGGSIVMAMVAASALILMTDGTRGEGFVLTSALLPILFAAAASTFTPIWSGRYFRFAHLFVLAMVALALWRQTRRRPLFLAGTVACLTAGLLWANLAFWDRLDLQRNQGMRSRRVDTRANQTG